MRYFAPSILALAASVVAAPQGVTSNISPSSPAPAGCQSSYQSTFEITVINVTSAKVKRDALECTLSGGVLKDSKGRTGYIASNYQFQFDGPPQAGAIYTAGFSVCSNGSLALGGNAIWYQCYSGGFYNLYDRSWAAQCSPIYIEVIGAGSSAPVATQSADGQPGVASQLSDGQIQATPNPPPVSQIGDGQIQATPAPKPVSQIGDGQVQAPSGKPAPVSQIGDGQVQAPSGKPAPVSQIGDGQVQAPSGKPAPVSQIGDGQVQAPSGKPAPVSQISDGQVQAPSATPAPVSQISDGQVQAPSGKPVQQISDGQVQASPAPQSPVPSPATSQQVVAASVTSASTPAQQTVNAAPGLAAEIPAVVVGLAAAVALL